MKDDTTTTRDRWARLRFSIVGPLLAAPPRHGGLREELARLAEKTWRHPATGERTKFGFSTIERWYYKALAAEKDPIGALTRERRDDAGKQPSMTEPVIAALKAQHQGHKSWSYQLHHENLVELAKTRKLGEVPSYATVRRYMRRNGLLRRRPLGPRGSPGAERAEARLADREVRSYEAEHVNALWHLDGHEARRCVLTRDGSWVKPVLVAAIDDYSRLVCHAQWYLEESAETVGHCLGQAFQKRKLPRAVLSDNGGANVAGETENGFVTLSVVHETTLSYSPYQNAKLEHFWGGSIEGRLMPQLEGMKDLTLEILNEATQAHVELEYHRKEHSEIGTTPLQRYLDGKDVGRPSPTAEELRRAFRVREWRTVRRSDLTVSVEAVRYEVPSRYRNMERVCVAYARWDLASVDMIDPETKAVLATLYPVDKAKNADGKRRVHEDTLAGGEDLEPQATGIAPLLKRLMDDYRATGLPPAYLPKGGASSGDDNTNGKAVVS